MSRNPLYQAAIDADEAFSTELIRAFGLKRSAEMRYRSQAWPCTDDALFAAAHAKHQADTAWLGYMREHS